MTMQEVLELIRMNGILYKQSERPLTDAEMAAMGNVWLYHFKDYPAEAVKRAFLAANAVCTFPIQPADIFVQLKTASAQSLPSESDLWQQTQKAARQIEQESYWAATGGIVTGSGKLTPTHLREHVWQVFKSLPQAVQDWAGSPSELVTQMSRPLAEVTQFVRPSFAKAVKAAQPQALALQPEVPRLEPPRVDRAQPSGNDFLADTIERPRRHKRKE